MSSDSVQAIIGIVILLFVLAIILAPVIALWIYIILQNSKRKRIRERILASRGDIIVGCTIVTRCPSLQSGYCPAPAAQNR